MNLPFTTIVLSYTPCDLHEQSDWLRLSTTANQITWFQQLNYHNILIFPYQSLKYSCAVQE